ncbi:hypothetical protein PPYC2_26870 [Paenibacillus polymyxa]|nr:hypothetical protein PPYC2_26870 [Paenibacillus polymyxa]
MDVAFLCQFAADLMFSSKRRGVEVKNGRNSSSKHITNDLSKSQLYLVKDSSMPTGYIIITGYPVFK